MHDGIAFVGLIAVRYEVIGLLPIAGINLVFVHEAHHVDGVLGFKFEVINLLRVD